ncbi:MAG: homoserine kinase [Deltaproteobacteria bacterium]|nr:MAG: homoserine kinase [Deltaproteobacteria bacterium]
MSSPHEVRAFAPGTVANLGPGFDLLGLAVEGTGDTVVARRVDGDGVRIATITGDGGRLPRESDRNTAAIAAAEVLRRTGVRAGVELEVHKGMPIGSGLGSSAASAAAAAFATNALLGSPLRRAELVPGCIEAEAAVAGRHADNVAPAILGGLVLVRSLEPLSLLRLPVPAELGVVVVTPRFEVSTRAAREALPADVPMGAMVRNGARLATLVSACYSGDVALLAECLFDEVVTPARAALTPGSDDVMDAALGAGALGASMSGSGPSIFALVHHPARGPAVRDAMIAAFGRAGLEATGLVSRADAPGARLL